MTAGQKIEKARALLLEAQRETADDALKVHLYEAENSLMDGAEHDRRDKLFREARADHHADMEAASASSQDAAG